MSERRITFVGGGNMAQAMVQGLIASRTYDAKAIVVLDPDESARRRIADLGVTAYVGLQAMPPPVGELVVLAVKPQAMKAACLGLHGFISGVPVLSIAAGLGTGTLAKWMGGHLQIVRSMPNTPALIRAGVTAAYPCDGVTSAQREIIEKVLASVGKVVWIDDEKLLDAVTAVSGSGPAYVFYLIEAMRDVAREMGLDPGTANTLAVETFLGAALLAAKSDEDVAKLRERVTSKGGTTEAALKVFATEDIAERFKAAIRAARDRGEALGKTLDSL